MEFSWTKCARMNGGISCGCQEFEPSELDPLVCDCCECHRHFHVPLGAFPDERGCCRSSILDFCQCFIPSVENVKKCGCCGCHKNFHEKVMENKTPAESMGEKDEVIGEKRPFLPIGNEDQISDPCPKRIKVDEGVVKSDSLGSKSLDSMCNGLSTNDSTDKKSGIPLKLQKNWEKLQVSCPFDQFGEYYPKLSEKGKKKGLWVIYCVPCDKEFSPQTCDNLQNFTNHLKPKGGTDKSVHELALLSKSKAQKAVEEKALKEASVIEKRRSWIEQHSKEGIEMLDNFSWRCKICDFEGKFGVVDTIGQHIGGGPHSRAKKASITSRSSQSTIQAWMSKGVAAGKAQFSETSNEAEIINTNSWTEELHPSES